MLFVKNYQHTEKNPSVDTETCLSKSQSLLIQKESPKKLISQKKLASFYFVIMSEAWQSRKKNLTNCSNCYIFLTYC